MIPSTGIIRLSKDSDILSIFLLNLAPADVTAFVPAMSQNFPGLYNAFQSVSANIAQLSGGLGDAPEQYFEVCHHPEPRLV